MNQILGQGNRLHRLGLVIEEGGGDIDASCPVSLKDASPSVGITIQGTMAAHRGRKYAFRTVLRSRRVKPARFRVFSRPGWLYFRGRKMPFTASFIAFISNVARK